VTGGPEIVQQTRQLALVLPSCLVRIKPKVSLVQDREVMKLMRNNTKSTNTTTRRTEPHLYHLPGMFKCMNIYENDGYASMDGT
jgi:hypothetical protein